VGAVMAAIVVILSPSKAACEYKAFYKDVTAFWRCQVSDCTWIIDSKLDIQIIESELSYHLDESDELFVAYLAPKWSVRNNDSLDAWLSHSTRRWLKPPRAPLFERLFGKR
jgi:hypothetical protein